MVISHGLKIPQTIILSSALSLAALTSLDLLRQLRTSLGFELELPVWYIGIENKKTYPI